MEGLPFERYAAALGDYIRTRREHALYEASLLSQHFVEQRAGPDEIVALHFESLDGLLRGLSYRDHARAVTDAHQFLLEIMIAYGVTYREYLDLKVRENERDAAAREELLATIAHELRSPIAAAQINLDMAKRHLARGRVELVAPSIGAARGALDRLSRLTANLMRSSQAYVLPSVLVAVELGQVLKQAREWAQPSALDKEIVLEGVAEAAEPVTVCGNEDALLTVFGNLLANAIRYTPERGRVQMRLGAGEVAWVEITDSGIGMSDEVQARIFDKFYRGPEARQVEAHGLGLGLTLVAQAVAAHHGHVSVRSVPHQGTTFRVELPLAPAEGCGEQDREGSDG